MPRWHTIKGSFSQNNANCTGKKITVLRKNAAVFYAAASLLTSGEERNSGQQLL